MIQDDEEHMVDHASVSKVRSGAQQLMAVSLNECFQLYTQEEKVSTRYTGHSRKYCDSFWFGLSAFGSNCLANIAGRSCQLVVFFMSWFGLVVRH